VTAHPAPISVLPEGRQRGSPTNPCPVPFGNWEFHFDPLGFTGERRVKLGATLCSPNHQT
ncbi:MAG: hypothetical protein ACK4I8_09580, partial [Armatimonadota bacterium]